MSSYIYYVLIIVIFCCKSVVNKFRIIDWVYYTFLKFVKVYWYIVKTKRFKTMDAYFVFNNLGVDCFVPSFLKKTKKGLVKTPLITGYVFVKLPEKIQYGLINRNPFTTDVIKVGNKAVVVPEIQMNTMINHLESIYKNSDFERYEAGDIIEISHGLFQGISGKIIEIKNNKIYLYLEATGSRLSLTVG